MSVRMTPKDRKNEILLAGLKAAERLGFTNVRQADIAKEAECGFGTVTLRWGTMAQLRRAIMRQAVKQESLSVIATGLAIGDPNAKKAPEELKKKALATLSA